MCRREGTGVAVQAPIPKNSWEFASVHAFRQLAQAPGVYLNGSMLCIFASFSEVVLPWRGEQASLSTRGIANRYQKVQVLLRSDRKWLKITPTVVSA